MSVTSLAILSLYDIYVDASWVPRLEEISDRMRSVAMHGRLVFHRQIENPQILYIVAGWPSLRFNHAHSTEVANEAAEDLLVFAQPLTLIHFNLDFHALPLDAPVVSIERLFVAKERKKEFDAFFRTVEPLLQEYVAPWTFTSGWRVDLSDEQQRKGEEEWILVAGWPTVEKHQDFSKTDMWERYSKIKEMIIRAEEVVHSTKLAS